MVVGAAKPCCLFFALLAYLIEVALHCCIFFEDLLGLGSFSLHFFVLPFHGLALLKDAIQFLKSLRILVLGFIILPSQLLNLHCKLFASLLFMHQLLIEQVGVFLKLIDIIA